MGWNDIEILKLIDLCEESETGSLITGFALLNRAAPGQSMDAQRDYHAFAHELVLARDAGLLTFEDANGYMQPRPDPARDPHLWLQHIRDIRLTFAGRGWARGRVLLVEWPDPGEDDGRMITGLSLQEIAREISRTFLPEQLQQFLHESSVPDEFLTSDNVGETGSEYVLGVLARLLRDGSAGRRALRTFVGRWLSGELHAGPDISAGRRIRALLAKQGWHIRDGRLVVGEIVRLDEGTLDDQARRLLGLHPEVRTVAGPLLLEHQVEAAVYEGVATVVTRIRKMTGLATDGAELMKGAFDGAQPLIRLADVDTPRGRAIQEGLYLLFAGVAAGLGNPDDRSWYGSTDEIDALDQLGVASMLLRRLDEAGVPRGSGTN